MDINTLSITSKIRRIGIFILSFFALISMRLIYLQIIQQGLLYIQSQKNFLRVEKIKSPRGNILDVNQKLMATNRPSTDLYWHGTGSRYLTQQQVEQLEIISKITGNLLYKDPAIAPTIMNAERYSKDILLVADLSLEQLCQIEEQCTDNRNVRITTTFKRHYPFHTTACHIVGYLGTMDVDLLGKMGLEKICHDKLKGQEGKLLRTINSCGTSFGQVEISRGLAGQNIYTTIDLDLQKIAEYIFPPSQSGVVILMDPNDGAIRALVSRPDFDPELFLRKIKMEEWKELQDQQPFLNRAFNACYPPGSIFKIATISAALENGVISADDHWFCPGYFMYAQGRYGCALHTGHGTLSTCDSLTHSCNIMFFEIGKRLNVDIIADYAHRFGLGAKTGSLFAEKKGVVPNRAWKKETFNQRWWPGETLSVAVGQSFTLVTPIQVACMIGSIFTRNRVKPRILIDEPIERQPLAIRQETLNFIKKSLRDVVIQGTARKIGRIPGFEVYAKTSTAQVCALKKRDMGDCYLEHAWLASYFAYKDQKPLVLIILVEHAGTSRVPVGLARNFLLEYKRHIEGEDIIYDPNISKKQELDAVQVTTSRAQ